jgi:hypothetical protein
MTPDEWADVFKVGADTFGRTRDFGAALLAMSAMRQRAETDSAFAAELAEELTSLAESKDWITHPGGMTTPERCGVCGTLITMVPEVHVTRRGEPEPAVWEAGQWRKHTPRRCNAMRAARD